MDTYLRLNANTNETPNTETSVLFQQQGAEHKPPELSVAPAIHNYELNCSSLKKVSRLFLLCLKYQLLGKILKYSLLLYNSIRVNLLSLAGDIEKQPGPLYDKIITASMHHCVQAFPDTDLVYRQSTILSLYAISLSCLKNVVWWSTETFDSIMQKKMKHY